MGEQWGKAEVVNHVSFIAVPKVGEVLLIGDIGFRDEQGARCELIEEQAYQSNNRMRLFRVNARMVRLFPEIGNGIQSQYRNAGVKVMPYDFQDFNQDPWVGKIQIHLIMAESAPDMTRATLRFDLCE